MKKVANKEEYIKTAKSTVGNNIKLNISEDIKSVQKVAAITKKAMSGPNVMNAATQFYSPRLTPDTWYLPRSRKMLLKWVDIFFDWDPYVYSILMMHSRYPISNFNLICDEKQREFLEEVLHNEDFDILDLLREMSLSFNKYGECIVLGDWDEEERIWKGFSVIDPGLIEVEEIPFTGKYAIYLEIPEKYKVIMNSKLEKDLARQKLIPQIIKDAIAKGQNYIWLDNTEGLDENGNYSPSRVCMIVNKTDVGEKGLRGIPPLTPILKCIAGDTKIALLDGSTPTVKELYDNNVQNIELYNIDENNNIVPGKAEKIIKTTIEKGLKITFDNGESITVTKDHPLMTRNGKYVQAQNLKVGDSMMPLYRKTIQFKNRSKYRKIYNPRDSKWYWEHRLLLNRQNAKDDNIIHHINRKGDDNRLSNLTIMTRDAHTKYHATNYHIYTKDELKNLQEKAKIARQTSRFKQICKEAWNNEKRHKHMSKVFKNIWNNLNKEDKEKWLNNLTNSHKNDTTEKRIEACKNTGSNKQYIEKRVASRLNKAQEWAEIIGLDNKQCPVCLEIKSKTEFSLSKSTRDGLNYCCKQCDSNRWSSRSNNYIDTPTKGYKKCNKCGWIKEESEFYQNHTCKECEHLRSIEKTKQKHIQDEVYLNHKIIAIEEVGETQFYGVQNAAPYFNFAIAFEDGSGIFSKNTLVFSDYLRKAQMARVQRFAYPIEIWKYGDVANDFIPDDETLSKVQSMLSTALANPPYSIVYTPLLTYEAVGATGNLLNIYDDYNFVENQILVGLGTNKNIVLGEGGWVSNAKTLSLQRLIMDYQVMRDLWERKFLKNFVLRPLCLANGYYKKSIMGKTIPIMPQISWTSVLDIQNDEDTKKLYTDMWKDKLISTQTLFSKFPDLNFETEKQNMEKEKGTIFDSRDLPAPVLKTLENKPNKENIEENLVDTSSMKPPRPQKMDI